MTLSNTDGDKIQLTLIEAIDLIPFGGHGEWYHRATRGSFVKAAEAMAPQTPDQEIYEILKDLHDAVAGHYGDYR